MVINASESLSMTTRCFRKSVPTWLVAQQELAVRPWLINHIYNRFSAGISATDARANCGLHEPCNCSRCWHMCAWIPTTCPRCRDPIEVQQQRHRRMLQYDGYLLSALKLTIPDSPDELKWVCIGTVHTNLRDRNHKQATLFDAAFVISKQR